MNLLVRAGCVHVSECGDKNQYSSTSRGGFFRDAACLDCIGIGFFDAAEESPQLMLDIRFLRRWNGGRV